MVASPTAESSSTSKAKSSTVARSKPSGQPNTLDMVIDAITTLNDKKGASIPAIKSYILTNYLTVDPNMLKYRLKKAIEKGIKEELLARPKSSAEAGASLNGRFRLNKTKLAALEKAKQPKTKPKAKAEKPKAKKPKSEKSKESPKKNASKKKAKPAPTTEVKKSKEGKSKKTKATPTKSPSKTKEGKVKKNKNKPADKKTPKKPTKKSVKTKS